MTLHPYLFFTGNAQEAMEFYQTVFGGKLDLVPNDNGIGLMHGYLNGGDITLMASDGTRTEPYGVSNVSLSLNGSDEEKITAAFTMLKEGATNVTDLKKESWGDTFGQLTDRFGIDWMANISER